jgi:hypothetical protein
MKQFIRQLFRRKAKPVSPRARRPRLGLEALEERQMLSASPLTFTTVNDSIYAAGSVAGAQGRHVVPLAPMMQTVMQGTVQSGQVEVVRIHLSRGEALTAEAQSQVPIVSSDGTPALVPMPYGPAVSVRTATGTALSGVTTISDNGLPALAFRANKDGDYFIQVSNAQSQSPLPTYLLTLREVGADTSNALPRSYLQNTSNVMYAALTGDVLTITGPTGHGFGIKGNWRQTTATDRAGLVTSTYSASGIVYLETAVGEVPLKLAPNTSVVLTTSASAFGQFVGTVKSFRFKADMGIGPLATNFNKKFGLDLGSWQGAKADLPGLEFGLKLGDTDLEDKTGAPLNPAVPYLYAHFSTNLGLSFGDITIAPSNIKGAGYSLDMVLDPADPMLYLHVGGIPGMDDLAIAASNHGLIPFEAKNQPEHASGKVFGHVYMQGSLNLATLTENEVPVVVKGDMVINLDSLAHTGFSANGRTISQLLKSGAAGAWQVLSGASFGINGEIDLTVSLGEGGKSGSGKGASSKGTSSKGLTGDLSLPAIKGTMIYDASAQQFALNGAMPNAMSGLTFLQGTPLEALTLDNADVDGYVDAHGQFSLALTKRLNLLEGQTTGTITVDNAGIHGSVGFTPWGLSKAVTLTGAVGFDGTFSFTGDIGLSVLSQSVDVTLTVDNHGIHGSATVNVLGYDVHVQGDFYPWGGFRMVGSKIMNVAEAGWSFFQVTWDQEGLTIDNDSLINLSTRLKATWSAGGSVIKQVWDTAGTYTYQLWDDFSHLKITTYKDGSSVTQTWYKATRGIRQAGDYVKDTVDKAGKHVEETWPTIGNYVKKTWDKAGNYTYEEVNKKGQVVQHIEQDVEVLAKKADQTFTDFWNKLLGK